MLKKTQKVQKCYLKCSIYKIGGATAVFVLLVLQIIQTFGPPDNEHIFFLLTFCSRFSV